MKREGGRRLPQLFPDLAGRHSFTGGLHQQPTDIEAGFLSECRQSGNGVYLFHISSIRKLIGPVKNRFVLFIRHKVMIIEPIVYGTHVKALLADGGLRSSDLGGSSAVNLFGCRNGGTLVGVVGLELYGSVALLRSLVVSEPLRQFGLGRALTVYAETWAGRHGVVTLYLLTGLRVGTKVSDRALRSCTPSSAS